MKKSQRWLAHRPLASLPSPYSYARKQDLQFSYNQLLQIQRNNAPKDPSELQTNSPAPIAMPHPQDFSAVPKLLYGLTASLVIYSVVTGVRLFMLSLQPDRFFSTGQLLLLSGIPSLCLLFVGIIGVLLWIKFTTWISLEFKYALAVTRLGRMRSELSMRFLALPLVNSVGALILLWELGLLQRIIFRSSSVRRYFNQVKKLRRWALLWVVFNVFAMLVIAIRIFTHSEQWKINMVELSIPLALFAIPLTWYSYRFLSSSFTLLRYQPFQAPVVYHNPTNFIHS